ncbi:MAG: proline dehydrogenase [Polyangiaceae bacterium]|nr:proline dehydrogenase [Polyangiaceae bacterium]
MKRSAENRAADVRRIVLAARDVAASRDAIMDEIIRSSGLSREGVELAFEKHLELFPEDAEIASLVAAAGDAERVAVILSANVFVGALRALAIARAASADVVVRPSKRDPAFARALVRAAALRGDSSLQLDEDLDVAAIHRGQIHVYGRDETIAAVAAKSHVPVVGHGSGMGIAWISHRADFDAAAAALANDVVAFDQRGCLSPRIALVEGDDTCATSFGGTLHEALERLGRVVPRGFVPAAERADSERYVSTMTYAGKALVGSAHVVAIAPSSSPLVLPPSYRHVHVTSSANAGAATGRIAHLSRAIVAVGSDDIDSARRLAPSWARLSKLGWMQRPPFDGPVDHRVSMSASV